MTEKSISKKEAITIRRSNTLKSDSFHYVMVKPIIFITHSAVNITVNIKLVFVIRSSSGIGQLSVAKITVLLRINIMMKVLNKGM